jgi:arginine/lysine/ornithine decarboxylase
VEWLTSSESSYLCCKLSADDIKEHLEKSRTTPTAVYLTSPDYLGNTSDIKGIADLCHSKGILLIVDNAHGAYLNFLPTSRHPIALGTDICCDSAHKTLPALTGAAYLHISPSAPELFCKMAKSAMALFGSTSPSYLILQSLDRTNAYIGDGYREKLSSFASEVSILKAELEKAGYVFIGDEAIKLTFAAKKYGYTGYEMALYLEDLGIIPEFADPDHLVLMLTPENGEKALARLKDALLRLPKKCAITTAPPSFSLPRAVLSPREAVLSPSETVEVENALGRTLAAITVGCPPAVPIVVSGEVIDSDAIECFKYYGISTCSVIKN